MNDHIHEILFAGIFESMRIPTVLTEGWQERFGNPYEVRVDGLLNFRTTLQHILTDIDSWLATRRAGDSVAPTTNSSNPSCRTDAGRTFLLYIREQCDQEEGHLEALKWSVIAEYLRFILEKSNLNRHDCPTTLHDIDVQIEFFRDHFVPRRSIDRVQLYYDTVHMFLEQTEPVEAAADSPESDPPRSSNTVEPEPEPEPEPGDQDKKEQVREILDLLEKQVSESSLSEGKYKDYAGLLMEVFQGLD